MSAGAPRRLLGLLLALACALAGAWLAVNHPLAPGLALAACTVWLLVALRWPHAWLLVVPAAVPVLALAPWTGWIAAQEFDLLVLAALAAGHLRLALWPVAQPAWPRPMAWLVAVLWVWLLLGLALGWADAQAARAVPPEAYTGWANTLRVGKGMAFVLLALPLLRAALAAAPGPAQRLLHAGMVAALVGLVGAVLWERAAFPGLFNLADDYRTTGLFWDMHVGGAAIDAFLALSVPFAVWAVVAARRPWAWAAAALLAQVLAYVCLTTFARGVYGAVLGGLAVAAVLVRRQRAVPQPPPPPWRARANAWLRVALVLEVAGMALVSSFLVGRLGDMDNDFGSRWAHWTRGLAVLQSPADWLGGVGLGRLPARYAALGRTGELPGAAELRHSEPPEAPGRFLRLYGPATRLQLAGRYALTQQVEAVPGVPYRVALDVRAPRTTRLRIQVCERHLLYAADCQYRDLVQRGRAGSTWQRVELELAGPSITGGPRLAPRLVVLSLAVTWPGTAIDIDNLRLSAGTPTELLDNGGFESGLAHWFPVVRAYFLPWHIDNLYLETLIERGAVGLALLAALVAMAWWRLVFGAAREAQAAPYLAAALASGCALGLVSSVMDVPRIAFLFLLLAFWSLHLPAPAAGSTSRAPPTPL
ncbi:hypothetical protein [Pseudorhodoferax sp. Leaf267]|uniref:hypothetical protein n=1 Tax=Pseudorhodoferax sp. Leaf267 TaxID=1736316 RepID=UPI0006F23A9B|nr:hypothetical protein [Pseudorhodoferax sp. Leaf267]KQP23135.1 hypothetical protein ASF43_04435 [Pseudorhodoferax sp. Leaf267]